MSNENFFQVTREQSRIKSAIVSEYFWVWANVIIPTVKLRGGNAIAYIDLFAGPGRYEDDKKSTPLLILEQAIHDPQKSNMLITIFNDADSKHVQTLEKAIKSLPGIDQLRYPPQVFNREVGENIVEMFEQMEDIPTFFFVDPWGYKGLSLQLINSVLKNWGCDCVFFFNYNRINMGLENDAVKDHMDALFGPARASMLRKKLETLSPDERELTIVEEIAQALHEMEGKFVLPFRFRDDKGKRTSHHLIFVTKHFKGYEIMKGIMAGVSTTSAQGVSSFEYSPASKRQPLLFEFSRPLDDLQDMLLTEYAGRELSFEQIYQNHSIDKPYLAKHYRSVLKQLEEDAKITVRSEKKRRKGTFAEHVKIIFPSRR